MKILIIEDDLNKVRQLADFVRGLVPEAEILERRSYQSGLKAAISQSPDVILLDMTVPTYDVGGSEAGGRIRALGGRDVLSQLSRRRIRARVVVVTQFESFGDEDHAMNLAELNSSLAASFGDNYVCTIFYQPAESKWKVGLGEALRDIVGRVQK